MPELEAITVIEPTDEERRRNPTAVRQQYGWRSPLRLDKPIRLGRLPAESDWAVPEDGMISGYHAVLTWDGTKLTVRRRDRLPPHPPPPANPIWYNGARVEECSLGLGESFVIGQTRFTVRPDGEAAPASVIDATVAQHTQDLTRAQLEAVPFADPAAALKALARIPNVLRGAASEQILFRQMLRVIMEALPWADGAGVVNLVTDTPGEVRLALLNHHARASAAGPDAFTPSRRLVQRAITERKSCLHVWSSFGDAANSIGASDFSMAAGPESATASPWAICTPFLDDSRTALYLTGLFPRPAAAADPQARRDLTEYQKIAELMTGLLEVTRQTHRLTGQVELLRQALPRRVWKYLEDPVKRKELLEPRETDVAILFCDLRNYSKHVEKEAGGSLLESWRKVANELNKMSGAIATYEGVVARVQGDAVMGFWGWPDPIDDNLAQTAGAAIQIRKEFTSQLGMLQCGMGMAFGRAVAGRLGATDLVEVDLYGPVVNLAARLEQMTKAFGVGVIVSEEVALRLASAARMPGAKAGALWGTRRLGKVRPKGMTPCWVYELIPYNTPGAVQTNAAVLRNWQEAVDQFTNGKWAEAYDNLRDWFEDDPAAQCLIREMDRHGRKPPADWDGSFVPQPPP